jgi:hypothetical protein
VVSGVFYDDVLTAIFLLLQVSALEDQRTYLLSDKSRMEETIVGELS